MTTTLAAPTKCRTVPLDPLGMRIERSGVAGFYWPVGIEEIYSFRDRFLTRAFALSRALRERDPAEAQILRIVLPAMLYRAMGLFECVGAIKRAKSDGVALIPHGWSLTLRPILDGQAPEDHPHDLRRRLHQPFPAWPWWYAFAAALRDHLRRDEIPWRSPAMVDLQSTTVTVSLEGTIPAHARSVREKVVYCRPRHWFPRPLVRDDLARLDPLASATRDAAVQSLLESATVQGVAFPTNIAAYLKGYLEEASGVVRHHLERLARRPERLPRRLWVTSSVTTWSRVLCSAVQRAGGTATGHEHGSGDSWARPCGDTRFEFDLLDRFLAYSDGSAQGMAAQRDSLELSGGPPCEIVTLPEAGPNRPRPARKRDLRSRKRVMLVSSFYRGDLIRFRMPPADIVVVDWQVRLFAQLKSWGYVPLFRPHPESPTPAPPAFLEVLGVEAPGGSFEAALAQSDIVIFDYPLSTAWRTALGSDLAMVVVDFDLCPFDPEARALLSKRAAILRGSYDGERRAQVDWEELRDALEMAPSLDDPTFFETYFGSHA